MFTIKFSDILLFFIFSLIYKTLNIVKAYHDRNLIFLQDIII